MTTATSRTNAISAAIVLAFLFQHFAVISVSAYTFYGAHSGQHPRWPLAFLDGGTIRWKIEGPAPEMLRQSVLACLQQWSDASSGKLKFEEGSGGIRVIWDAGGSVCPDSMFLGYTWFETQAELHITSALIAINAKSYSWHRGGTGGVAMVDGVQTAELDGVLTHEIGHALGLNHSDLSPQTMFGSISSEELPTMLSKIFPGAETLHVDDKTGIIALYNQVTPLLLAEACPTQVKSRKKVFFSQTGGNDATVWNFGDGTTATGASPTHKFTAPGIYVVTATCNGAEAKVVVTVTRRLR